MPIFDTFLRYTHYMVILTLVGTGCYNVGGESLNSV